MMMIIIILSKSFVNIILIRIQINVDEYLIENKIDADVVAGNSIIIYIV